jgi:hypothetical protein
MGVRVPLFVWRVHGALASQILSSGSIRMVLNIDTGLLAELFGSERIGKMYVGQRIPWTEEKLVANRALRQKQD